MDGASASAQASAADLAAARLSVQGELAVNYFSLRQTDAQRTLLADTITGYQRKPNSPTRKPMPLALNDPERSWNTPSPY